RLCESGAPPSVSAPAVGWNTSMPIKYDVTGLPCSSTTFPAIPVTPARWRMLPGPAWSTWGGVGAKPAAVATASQPAASASKWYSPFSSVSTLSSRSPSLHVTEAATGSPSGFCTWPAQRSTTGGASSGTGGGGGEGGRLGCRSAAGRGARYVCAARVGEEEEAGRWAGAGTSSQQTSGRIRSAPERTPAETQRRRGSAWEGA